VASYPKFSGPHSEYLDGVLRVRSYSTTDQRWQSHSRGGGTKDRVVIDLHSMDIVNYLASHRKMR